jgi:hypothetical protein
VESGVGYVKKNFLNGLDISDFKLLNRVVPAMVRATGASTGKA